MTSKKETQISENKIKSKNSFGLRQLISQGLGGTIGGPIFAILGFVILQAKGGMLISLIINGFLMLCFVLIYSELALSLPIEGGGYSFSKEAIGGFQGFLIGWLIWVGNLLFVALSGLGFALSLEVFLPERIITPILIPIIAVMVILFFLLMNYQFPSFLVKLMKISTFTLLGGFAIYIILGLVIGATTNSDFSGEILVEPVHFSSILSMTAYTFVIYCVYEWNSTFESLTRVFDQIKRPRQNIPRAFIISIVIAILIYWMVGLVTLLNIGNSTSSSWDIITNSSTPLADSFGLILNSSIGVYFMGFIGLVATITSINAGIQMSVHILHSLARDGYIHSIVNREHKGIQWIALSISGILILIFASTMGVDSITEVSNFIFLFSMIFLSLSVIFIRKTRPRLIRPWKVPLFPYTPILGIIASGVLIISMTFSEKGLWGILTGVIIIVFGVIYYLFQISRRDRLILILNGSKIGISILGIILLWILDIKLLSINSHPLNFSILLYIVAIFALFSHIFDLFPIRGWLLKIMPNDAGDLVVTGITQHSEKGEKVALIFNYVLSGILILFGIISLLIASLSSSLILQIEISPQFQEYWEYLQIILNIILIIQGITYIVNGGIIILQEIEMKKR